MDNMPDWLFYLRDWLLYQNGWMIFTIIALGATAMLVMVKMAERKGLIDSPVESDEAYVCTECLTSGRKRHVVPGSFLVQLLLYGCGFIPGVAYASWRESAARDVCPCCGKDSMIPVDSPRGQQLMSQR
jgi:hypothetical protein